MKPSLRVGALVAAWLGACALAQAQAPAPATPARPAAPAASQAARAASAPASAEPAPSALTAELFYQLLLGELSARSNDPGTGFSLVLDAARKTGDAALFRRATEIALQARAGESALQSARAWQQAHPDSREANRFVLQILLALNRIAETVTPLHTELALAPTAGERNIALALVPRQYARASDKRLAASVVEKALADVLSRPEHVIPAWSAIGRVRLAAGDTAGALDAVRHAQAQDAAAEGPALLALEILANGRAEADELVKRYIGQRPLPEVRMAYARILLDNDRLGEAREQLKVVTERRPELADAWLLLGLLQKEKGELSEAQASLQRFIGLAAAPQRGDPTERNRSLARAYLTLSQIAQQRGDLNEASAWLDKITDPQDLLMAQTRRAELLAKQGRMAEARQLIRSLPGRTPQEVRTRLLVEVQLLRQHKQHQAAYELLASAVSAQPQDSDLLYEQAMSAEKLGRHQELEQLLRKVMALKPDSPHAYNALGYSLADRGQRLAEARTLILKALDITPGDPMITDSLGWVEFRLGNNAEAQRLLEQAFRGRPDAEIAAHLGEVLWVTGQRERARAIWQEGLLLDQENEALLETMRRFKVAP